MRAILPLAVLLGAGTLAIAGCTGRAAPTPSAEPSVTQGEEVPLPTPPRIIPNVRLLDDTNAVPPFADAALISRPLFVGLH